MKRVLVVLAFFATACGNAGPSTDRTIDVTMRDTTFAPEAIEIEQGQTVRFKFTNRGKVAHDAFIGSKAEQRDHEREMREMDAAHHMATDEAVTVDPGEDGTLTHRFTKAGAFEIGCHQAGHYEAGMILRVRVS